MRLALFGNAAEGKYKFAELAGMRLRQIVFPSMLENPDIVSERIGNRRHNETFCLKGQDSEKSACNEVVTAVDFSAERRQLTLKRF